jgi:hypothetical protein
MPTLGSTLVGGTIVAARVLEIFSGFGDDFFDFDFLLFDSFFAIEPGSALVWERACLSDLEDFSLSDFLEDFFFDIFLYRIFFCIYFL